MPFPPRPIAYVLAACNHGSMIVNRHDYQMTGDKYGYGVGFQLLNRSSFDPSEVMCVLALLECRRHYFGDGVVAIDGGANIGVHTVEWARHMHGWGRVLAFEAQEIVYYALAGNVALNNCLNARVRLAALGETCGQVEVPQPDYFSPASFGSLELRQNARPEFIGQQISYASEKCAAVPMVSLDSLRLERADLLKLDVEGMELEVLRGARELLARQRPIMIVEIVKVGRTEIEGLLAELGYHAFALGLNLLAVHAEDPSLQHLRVDKNHLVVTREKAT